jgi:hypothetical protein
MPRPVQVATGQASKRSIFKPEHQACEPLEDKPRYYYINPLQAPTGVWAGSQQYVDFELPPELGVLNSANLRISLQWNGADASPIIQLPSMPPTPYWLSRVEVYLGADLVSTTYADTIWHETLAFLSEQNAKNVADTYNLNLDLSPRNYLTPAAYAAGQAGTNGAVTPNANGVVTTTSSGFYYVSLDCTPLKSMKPYVRGFQSRFKYRIYFPSSVVAQYKVNNAGSVSTPPTFFDQITPAVASLQLIAEEAQVDATSLARLEAAHRTGVIDYTAIVSERLQDSPPSYVAGQNTTTFLRAFRNRSAALAVYFTRPVPPNDQLTQRLAFSALQLLDSRGNKITEILDNDLLTSKIFPDQINSSYPNSAPADQRTIVVLPFCSNLDDVINKGCNRGGMQLTSLEQLVVTPDNGTANTYNTNGEMSMVGTNTMLTAMSYSYAHITCVAGKHNIRFESSA